MAPFKALADICQSDLKMVREMMGDATAETKAMATPTPRAMSHTLPSDMEAPFMRPLETRLPQRAGEWLALLPAPTIGANTHRPAAGVPQVNLLPSSVSGTTRRRSWRSTTFKSIALVKHLNRVASARRRAGVRDAHSLSAGAALWPVVGRSRVH